MSHDYIKSLLAQLGVTRQDGSRLDAGETAFILKQLEATASRTYDIKYPAFLGRTLVPVNNSIPNGAQSFVYQQWDEFGMAQVITNYADDLPMVGTYAKEFTAPIRSIGSAYMYTIQDLRAAALQGMSLDQRRAMVARRVVEAKIDQIIAKGDADGGLAGFLNNTNVTLHTLATGTWSTATPAQILGDLTGMQAALVEATKQTIVPNTVVLGTTEYNILANTVMGSGSDKSILQTFLDNSPYVNAAFTWHKLDKADVAGTGPRMVMYDRNPEVLEALIPQEFEQFPPQAMNLAFKVPCHASVGGVQVRYPLGILYADGM